jgi:trimeric autotransporter adhesin
MRKFYSRVLAIVLFTLCSYLGYSQVSVTATAGTTGPTTYTTVKAAFDAVNAGTHTGSITVSVTGNTTENASAVLSASGTGPASYTFVLIKPAAGVTATINGNANGGTLVINGSNVTIDGSNNGTTSRNLTVSNPDTTSAKLAPIALISGASQLTNITVKNVITNKGLAGIAAIGSSSSAGQFANITISNNKIQASSYGIFAVTAVAAGNGSFTVTGNDLSASGANAIYNLGIYLQGVNGSVIRGNTVANFNSSEMGNDFGIWLASGSSNTVIEKNIISNIGHSNGDGYGGHGIRISSGTQNANISISNNMVSNIYGDGWNYTDPTYPLDNPIGILINGNQTGINVYYNTVHLFGNTLDRVNAISAGVYISTGSIVNMRNNIIVNNLGTGSAGYGAVGLFLSTGTGQLVAGDYNNYFVNPSTGVKMIGQIGTTGATTLSAWQTATGKETNSKNVNPVFTAPTDLHLVNGSNGGLENLGTPIAGITDDIDGDTRSTTTPDMGADEFGGTGIDITPPAINYTTLSFACATGDRTLSGVTIADASGVATTGALVPRIYYKKTTGSTWYSKPGTLSSGTATSGTWSFTIVAADLGTVAIGDNIEYYVIAQDNAATPNITSLPAGVVATNVNTVTTHPASPNTYLVASSLTGNFNVGAGQVYTTITAAVAAYNSSCLTGPVTFTLVDASYTAETLPIIIQNNPLASAVNTLTIKPAAGVNATISGATTVAMIQLKGADYVTIDGANTAGGTTKNLTVTTTSTSVIPLIWITSGSNTDGANNNTIKNVNLTGNASSTTAAGVIAGSFLTLGSEAEFPNNNNTISGNVIIKAQNAVFLRGNSTAANFDQNWNISGNSIGSTATADKLGFRGVFISNSQGFTINNNVIRGIQSSTTSEATVTGIAVSGGITGGTISQNRISDIKQMNADGWGANGIQLSSSSATSNVTVSNNFVWDVAGQGYAAAGLADNGYGIIVTAGGGYNIYYNTVNMNTNQANAAGLPAAFNVTSAVTAAGAINLRNNIFVNSQTTGTQRYVIYSGAANTVFSSINFNNYHTAGPNLGFIGSARANLAAIQTGFGGNANSTSVLPVFVSATDLHLNPASNSGLSNTATPIAGITTDIDGDTRSANTPDMGADEFTSTSTCITPAITTQPVSITRCAGTAAVFTVTATGTDLTYQWRKGTTNINGATTATYNIASVVSGDAGDYNVVITNGCGTVTSANANLAVTALPVITTQPANVTSCLQQNVLFSVVATGSNLTYQWRKDGTAITGATVASLIVTNLTASSAGSYSVVVSSGTCSVTSNSAVLTVSGPCTSLPNVDADITSAVLMPNVVNNAATLRVVSGRAAQLNFHVVDMNGRVVMSFSNQVMAGRNDIQLKLGALAAGTYQLQGWSSKGKLETIRMIKL